MRLARPLKRTPLWVRLVAGALMLAAIGLTVTGFVGVNLFRDYLVDQSGRQLSTFARVIAAAHWDKSTQQGLNCGGLPNDNATELIGGSGDVTVISSCAATVGSSSTAMPALPSSTTLASAAVSGQSFTETSRVGSTTVEWQIVVVPVHYRVSSAPIVPAKQGAESATYSASNSAATNASLTPGEARGYVLVATPLADVDATVTQLSHLDLAVDAAVILALLGLGSVIVRGTLRPLRQFESAAAAISAGDLARRVPDGHPKTEIGRLSTALNGMLGQIEAAFSARRRSESEALRAAEYMRQFVADAGHELRTPLASIRGIAELYRQGAADSRALPDLMRRIEDEAMRMGLLVEDLLLLARLDERRPLAHDKVHLIALTADAVTAARARAPQRNLAVSIAWPEDLGEPVIVGDESRLRQAVDNLIANAERHTPPDARIEVGVRPGAEPGWCVLEVADTGPGLSAEEAARVFERFYRADPARTRVAAGEGSGLGLAIVAAIASSHGGAATVESRPGEGARFRLTLPQAPLPINASDDVTDDGSAQAK